MASDEEVRTMEYVYYCERCRNTFEVDLDPEKPIPAEAVCPTCEYPHALKAFPASTMRPASECTPGSGC
jgi:DNA replicative helicase MCM subunit Mcm2 (Cdc46/Mcm family)